MRVLEWIRTRNAQFREVLRSRRLWLYVLKCLLGTFICHRFYLALTGHQLYWSIVSVLLVLAPGHRDSVQLALGRSAANAVGAAVGLACFLAPWPEIFSLSLAVVLTISVCQYFNLGGATRTALAALVIVFIQQAELRDWTVALERVGSVWLGCFVALLLTLAFQTVENRFERGRMPRP